MIKFFASADKSEIKYYLGLTVLFFGLAFSVSAATAAAVIGAIVVAESVVTSYLATWFSERS